MRGVEMGELLRGRLHRRQRVETREEDETILMSQDSGRIRVQEC